MVFVDAFFSLLWVVNLHRLQQPQPTTTVRNPPPNKQTKNWPHVMGVLLGFLAKKERKKEKRLQQTLNTHRPLSTEQFRLDNSLVFWITLVSNRPWVPLLVRMISVRTLKQSVAQGVWISMRRAQQGQDKRTNHSAKTENDQNGHQDDLCHQQYQFSLKKTKALGSDCVLWESGGDQGKTEKQFPTALDQNPKATC